MMPLPLSFRFLVLCGKTGSGKSSMLQQLSSSGFPVINLEKIASHSGSAFGGLFPPQPSQEDFEKELQNELMHFADIHYVFIEQKLSSIGKRKLPAWLVAKVGEGIFIQLNVSRQIRIENLLKEYKPFGTEKLKNALQKISGHLPANVFTECNALLNQSNLRGLMKMMLNYFDHSLKHTPYRPADIIIPVQTDDDFYTMQQLLTALREHEIYVV